MADPVDLEELRRLAEAATPGPWFVLPFPEVQVGEGGGASVAMVGDTEVRSRPGPFPAPENADADYIAAANPATILRLLDLIQQNPLTYRERPGTAIHIPLQEKGGSE